MPFFQFVVNEDLDGKETNNQRKLSTHQLPLLDHCTRQCMVEYNG